MSTLREAAEKVEMRPGDKLGAITVGLHDDPGIVLLRRIVDSISIVNKMACWDHFAMFELRDYLCERAELAKPDHFPDAGKMVQDGWIPVAERMPDSGCVVLACYRNSAGNLRRIRAEWVAAKTQESDDASDIGEYDEATDTYYDPQGWYERIDNWDDGFSAVGVSQGEVTHWMHLPDAPGAAAPRPAPAEPQPAAQQEPLFWYRPRSDGLYEGPIHNAQIERARKESGGWVPLYTQAGERKPLTDEPIEAAEWERECDDTDTILRALGLDPARCRTDGGSLKVQMIVGALAKPAAAPEGWQLVPVEPTEAMWSAGRDPVMFRELKHYRPASLPVPAWQRNPDGTVEKDTSKGTTAVHVWRSMLAAAPGAPTAPAPTSATVSEPDCHGRTGVDDGHRACGRDWSG